jgi:hypothetical protein
MVGRARSRNPRRQGALVIPALVCLSMGLAAGVCARRAIAAGVAHNPGAREVTLGFDKTEPGAAVSGGVWVHRGTRPRRSQARVIYSVAVPSLGRAETLRVRGVVGLTHCNESDQQPGGGAHVGTKHSPCESVADPYSLRGNRQYVPRIAGRVFLGASRSKHGRPLGRWQVERCDSERHHCPIVTHTHLNRPPTRHRTMYLNFAVTAFDRSARMGRRHRPVDVVELNGECKHHDYDPPGDRRHCVPVLRAANSRTTGELKVIRFGAARSPSRLHRTRRLINRQVPVRAHPRGSGVPARIVLRQPLRHLSPGDIVDASAAFHLRDHPGDGYVFRHFVRGQLFLSGDPAALRPTASGRSPDRWIAGSAGTNCANAGSGCEIESTGAVAVPQGAPRRMWVEYAAYAVDRGGVNGARTDVSHGRMTAAVDRGRREASRAPARRARGRWP